MDKWIFILLFKIKYKYLYKKILNDILGDKKQKNIYTQKIHNELKQCYLNHWQMEVEIA